MGRLLSIALFIVVPFNKESKGTGYPVKFLLQSHLDHLKNRLLVNPLGPPVSGEG